MTKFVNLALSLLVLGSAWPVRAQTGNSRGGAIPTPETGVIDGRRALMMLPAGAVTAADPAIAVAGCEAHLVPVTNYDEALVQPCGQWFSPPRGKYMVWLERGDEISGQTVLRWAAEKFTGRGMVVSFPLQPAGWVQLPDRWPDGAVGARLMHLEMRGRPFERRARIGSGKVRVPAGPVVGGIFNRSGEALSLSQPFLVKQAGTTALQTVLPRSGTDLLVTLVLPQSLRRNGGGAVRLAAEGTAEAPAVIVRSPERLIAIWYSVQGTTARLTGEPLALLREPVDISLRSGGVTTFRRTSSKAKPAKGE